MTLQQEKHLLALIKTYQDGEAHDTEIQELANFFTNHQKINEWPLDLELKHAVKNKIFNDIESRIKNASKKPTKVIPLYKRNIFKYAVAASIAALISLTFIYNTKESQPLNTSIANTIKIGTNKAILTIGDGENILLSKNESYTSNHINSDGKKLIYTTSKKSEIAYNYLTVPRGGEFELHLTDGSKIWLNSDSKLKYPTNFISGKPREVELLYGEAYFDISPSKNHNGSKFNVITKTQKVEVLGTEFNIKAYKEEAYLYTTLVEGKIALQNITTKKILEPNQQSVVNINASNFEITTVNVAHAIAWKQGDFIFNKTPLKDIMTVLERWYDVEVIFENEVLKNAKFIGKLSKYQNIEDILTLIKSTNIINNYDIKENTILLK